MFHDEYKLNQQYQQTQRDFAEKQRRAKKLQHRNATKTSRPLYAVTLAKLGKRLVQMGSSLQHRYALEPLTIHDEKPKLA